METAENAMAAPVEKPDDIEQPEKVKALVKQIQARIKHDLKFHKNAFERMREDMHLAKHGADKDYPDGSYKANIVGRHIQQKTAGLYAKNPKATAKRRETLDFAVWDEDPQSLQMAMMAIQQAQQLMAASPPDPLTGESPLAEVPDELQAVLEQANAVLADWQQGMQRRKDINKIGKTLEILFAQALREQKPVDFKVGIKQVVRRACTTGVGYVELGFQREMGPRPAIAEKLADFRARLDHIARLQKEASEGDIETNDAEMAELEASVMSLSQEPEIVLREGLIFDYPQATRVIPDCMTQNIVGFIGARHVTIEYVYTIDQVSEMFSVDLSDKKYIGYSVNGKNDDESAELYVKEDGESDQPKGSGLVRVWKHYDKVAGLVHYVADGYEDFLRESAAPDVFVEDFWPLYALTFNNVESEKEVFPVSDVRLIKDQQAEYNASRQGMREHRKAARPRWIYSKGTIDEEDIKKIVATKPFEATGINSDGDTDLAKLFQAFPMPGVDPNLYETGQLFTDMQIVVGAQEAQLGGISQATATETAIAASSSASSNSSSIDDLDAFLTMIARASGQIFMREMSPEKVMEIAGPGALWPQMTLAEISGELFLEVEAGSTGKPNQAIELKNWQMILPYIIQLPGVSPTWLARETLRRLDDRMDLTEALTEGMPSIMMMNQMKQAGTGDPASDPNSQGAEGGNNADAPPAGEGGSDPAFGSNQV